MTNNQDKATPRMIQGWIHPDHPNSLQNECLGSNDYLVEFIEAAPVLAELKAMRAERDALKEIKRDKSNYTLVHNQLWEQLKDTNAKLKAENSKLREQRNIWVRCSDDELSSIQQKRSNETIAKLDLEVQAAGQGVK